jgi:23S rRNA pseudouridine2605 synthase
VILLFHKPKAAVVTRRDELGRKTVYDLLPVWIREQGWVPVGRLDRDTRGLLLFVRDSSLTNQIAAPGYFRKVYEVWVRGHVQKHHLEILRKGVQVQQQFFQCIDVKLIRYVGAKSRLEMTLDEGKNRQVRRMFGSLRDDERGTPLKVVDLKQIQFGPIHLDVPSGHWRMLTDEEAQKLLKVPEREK